MSAASIHQLDFSHELVSLLSNQGPSRWDCVPAQAVEFFQAMAEKGEVDWQKILESQLQDATGYSHAIACASPSIAFYVALGSLEIEPNDEILLSSYAPVFLADVIRSFDAHPVLLDIQASSLEMDTEMVEDRITDRTRAILAIHHAGRPPSIEVLTQIANRHGLPVVEYVGPTAIEILGESAALRGEIIVGASGANAGAPANTIANPLGYLCTNNEKSANLARRTVMTPQNGINHNRRIYFEHRPAPINAAWEFFSLKSAADRWRRRCEIATTYTAVFAGRGELEVPPESSDAPHSWTSYVLRVNLQRITMTRATLVDRMRAEGLPVQVDHLPIHIQPYYQELYSYSPASFPVARNEFLRTIVLPVDTTSTDDEVQSLIQTVINLL